MEKILFLTPRFPYPPIGGDKLRAFNIIKYLAQQNEVTVLSLSEKSSDLNELATFKNYVHQVITFKIHPFFSYLKSFRGVFSKLPIQTHYYYSSKVKNFINDELKRNNYDLVFVHLIRMAEYIKDNDEYRKFIDLTDAISLNYERAKKYRHGIFRWINFIEHKRVRQYESQISKHFDKVFLISEVDKDYLNDISENSNIEVLENGVDLKYFYPNPNFPKEKKIIFLGNMRTFPNQDAALYFAEKIFPVIRAQIPDLFFWILGVYPTKHILALNKLPNVKITGFVQDIREHIWSSIATVSPIRVGAGVQNKILESMALGTPVITTPIGNEGINAKDKEEIFIANNSNDYKNILLKLIESKSYRENISINARRFVENNYEWNSILSKLDRIIS